MTVAQIREKRKTMMLKILTDEGPNFRAHLGATMADLGEPLSEYQVHSIMVECSELGLVSITKAKIRGRFAKFQFRYELAKQG